MELRSKTKAIERQEFKELQCTLSGLGFYESGMELQEMRQLFTALQASMTQNEAATLEREEMMGFKENDFDFLPMNEVHNSTMLSPLTFNADVVPVSKLIRKGFYERNESSPFSSPEVPAQQLTIQAEIHHTDDWIPPPTTPPAPSTSPCFSMLQASFAVDALELKRLLRKRSVGAVTVEHQQCLNEIINAKQSRIETETFSNCLSCDTIDSGTNMSHCAALSDECTDFSQDYNHADDGDAEWLPS